MTMDYGYGPEVVSPVPRATCPKNADGRPMHHYTRDQKAPDAEQWTCTQCGEVAPVQPGTGTPGRGLGWPS